MKNGYTVQMERNSDPFVEQQEMLQAMIEGLTDIAAIRETVQSILPAGYYCGSGGTHVWINNAQNSRVAIIQK